MNMKKLVLTLGIIFIGLITLHAQDASIEKQSTKLVNEYASVAQMTPDQAAKVRPILESFLATRKENKEKYAGNPQALKTANKANKENMKTQLQAVLSPDQIQKIENYNREKKEEKKEAQKNQQ
jgi:hypothetical protein